MNTKDIGKAFTVGVCTGLFASTIGFTILSVTVLRESPPIITENKQINLVNSESKVSSISYELESGETKSFPYSENYVYNDFKGVVVGCTSLLRYTCGVSSKKDAETIIKVLQKSVELGWVK